MAASGKMSLVVLRSWSDGPPKIRAIAPPDDDKAVYVPDHHGRFVAEEVKEDPRVFAGEHPRSASSASQYKEFQKEGHQSLTTDNHNHRCRKMMDGVIYRKSPLQRCYADANSNRHSYSGGGANFAGLMGNLTKACSMHLPLQGVDSLGKESKESSSRPNSASSPDNPDASSLEYTPPASPVNGRYRNLGPELAATIPKRTVRNSWIAEVKSRWNKSTSSSSNTTHPSSRVSSRHSAGCSKRASGGTLKSYGSSPNLIYPNNSKSKRVGRRGVEEGVSEEEEDGDYYDEDSFRIRGNGETPQHHRRSSLQRIHLDEEETGGEQQPFFNPLYKFGHNGGGTSDNNNTNNSSILHSNGANNNDNHNGNFTLLRNQLKTTESLPAIHCAGNLAHRRSASGIALSVDDDSQSDRSRSSLGYPPSNNSGNTSYSPSPPPTASTPNDHIYSSLTDIREANRGRLDPFKLGDTSGNSDVVLVEVIRKAGKNGNEGKAGVNKSASGEKYKLEKFGSVELIQKLGTSLTNGLPSNNKGKRHSVGEIEPVSLVANNKFSAVKVEGSPGKVARLKESLKRFGRFGRSNTDKIIRTHSDSGFSTDEVHGEFHESVKKHSEEENIYENPAEIIVTSLTDTGKDLHITVKPAPRKRSKPLAISSENIYAVPNHKTKTDKSKPSQVENGAIEQVTIEKCVDDACDNPIKQDQSETTALATAAENDEKSDRVSPITDDETHIPHLEFDKGENEQSTSHDESSRAESLSYSTTSHEQDRSMPQQIVQNHQHLVPKVDIVKSISVCSSSSGDTLNCEVTPVIRKRSFEKLNHQDQVVPQSKNRKQPVVKQISSSSVESNSISLKLDAEKQPTTEANKESAGESQEEAEKNATSCTTPVTPNELGSSDTSDMNSLSRTRKSGSHPVSHEDFNGQSDTKRNLCNVSNNSNGTEGPEIMSSKADERSMDFNGIGKYENGTASVQVPVQAVNRHVLGFGINSANRINDPTSNNLNDDQCNESIASTTSKNDSDWNRSSLRASLRGFCEDMLQEDKISIPVPDVVEAVINFDEDSSSIEQDEERENSIEYISVANVKVNRDKLHPRDELPSCVIALDLGSRGSGYAYWIKEESEFVRIGNVDGGSSCPASHKAPSWVMFDDLYLDGEEDGESSDAIRPGFGFQALDKYLTDDAHGQLSWRWREHFHEAKTFPYTLDSKASDDDLIFMMKSAIRHYGRQAMEQISQRKKGAPLGPTVILIAIPSTFDQRARQLVREAALEAGVLKESDSVALIEDSCATGLYCLHALKSKQKELGSKVTELSYLSVDCGASYLHFSGYQITEGKLRQLILPRSDPLIDSPESLFEAELSTVFTPSYIFNYQNKYKAGWLKLMTEFEHAKNRYDPLSRQNYYVFVPSSFVDHFRRSTSMEIEDALESSDMVWNKTGALGIPHWKMQRFLQPLLDYINDKIVTSMKKHKFEQLVVTGGRAGAKFYIDVIRTAAKGFGATLHVPKEYNAAVLQGSTISVTNLAPRLVIRSRFSIGVGVMTPFSEEIHPEEKRVMRDGKSWCADVWDSLIRADQELELNRVIIKRSYVGAQPGQSLLVLPLFKSPDEPKFVTESSVQKCCELKFTSGQRAWQEVELVLVCRPSELLIKAMDGGVMKSYVVVDFSD